MSQSSRIIISVIISGTISNFKFRVITFVYSLRNFSSLVSKYFGLYSSPDNFRSSKIRSKFRYHPLQTSPSSVSCSTVASTNNHLCNNQWNKIKFQILSIFVYSLRNFTSFVPNYSDLYSSLNNFRSPKIVLHSWQRSVHVILTLSAPNFAIINELYHNRLDE